MTLALVLALLVSSDATLELNVVEAIRLGLANNADIARAMGGTARAEQELALRKAGFRPTLNVSAGLDRFDGLNDPRYVSYSSTEIASSIGVTGATQFGLEYDVAFNHRYELIASGPMQQGTMILQPTLSLRQQLLRGNFKQNATLLDEGAQLKLAAEQDANDAAQTLANTIADAFWLLARDRALLGVARASLGLAERQQADLARLVGLGLRSQPELKQVEAAVAERKALVELARAQVVTSEAVLLQRLALPADAVHWRSNEVVTKPDDPFAKLELTPEEIVRSAETRYPLLRSLRKRVQAAETRALGSGYGTRPAFYVEGRGTVSYFTKDIDESFYEGFDAPATAGHVPFIGYVGLGMSVPLGRSTFDAVAEQARISERIARADLNQALAIVAAGARQYAGTVSALRNAVGFRQTAFEAASAALAGAERSFALGQTTIFEVLRLQELRVQAEASLAVAQFDLKRASWNQARAAGMLSDVLPPEYKTGTN